MTIDLKAQFPISCLSWEIKDGSVVICEEDTSGL